MKRYLVLLLGLILAISLIFTGISCKEEAVEEEAVEEEAVEEEAVEEEAVEEKIPVPENNVELSFWFQDWAGGVNWHQAFIDKFEEKYPTIDIELMPIPYTDLASKLIPSIGVGEEADIMMGYSDWIRNVDISELFLPLSPSIYTVEEFEEKWYDQVLADAFGSDGEVYLLPVGAGGNSVGWVFHKDLLMEIGVDASTIDTWDEIKDVGKKLSVYNDDGTIARSGILMCGTDTIQIIMEMIYQQGAGDKLYDSSTGEWNFNIPEAKNAVEFFQYFFDEEICDPFMGDEWTGFPNKLGAMYTIGPWVIGHLAIEFPDLDLGYIIVPPYPGMERKHLGGAWVSIMASKRLEGDKKNAGLLFMKEIVDDPDYYNIAFNTPYWVGLVGNEEYAEGIKQLVEQGEATYNQEIVMRLSESIMPNIIIPEYKLSSTEINQMMFSEMQKVWTGDQTIDQLLTVLSENFTLKEQEIE